MSRMLVLAGLICLILSYAACAACAGGVRISGQTGIGVGIGGRI